MKREGDTKGTVKSAGDEMIVIKNLRKSFDKLTVLKGITLSVRRGEIVSVVGPSGAG